ncbi:MAG TPA: fused MFS/spermidine synthase [Methylomirabilota bacterium]|jgi:spermidine synthase|nr:fused MFS/spermidine synthase [Methylomirabilota bacterium]
MSPWQEQNLAAIHTRLAAVQRSRPGVLFEQQSQYNYIIVRRTFDQLLLCYRHTHRRIEEIESRLDLTHPLALLSEYTQAMLLVLAWRPAPQRILLIGLGGGRLQMVLHHYMENTSLYTVELDPLVAEVAQRFFGFATDERQHLILKDGRAYVKGFPTEAPFDVILLDAYRAGGVPFHLSTREFYHECRSVLAPGGVVATNLQSGTPLYDAERKTFAAVFHYTAVVPLFSGNVVVIGSDVEQLSGETLRARAVAVQQRYGFDFALPQWAEATSALVPYRPNAPVLRDADVTTSAPPPPKRDT